MSEQMELDLRNIEEQKLSAEVEKVVSSTYETINDHDYTKNRYEGFGIASEQVNRTAASMKEVSRMLATYLKMLPTDDGAAVKTISDLSAAAASLAGEALMLAAQTRKIANDLYQDEPTPLEEMNDGFQEVEEPDPEGEEDSEEDSGSEEDADE